eukprot:TRINITY_DN400_c0_g1_i2.p1 TRINITY_DN400_c0_g1~~TRINITY_DN400_c0_g1_i2.p1  ORF type:complete len:104 (+),score=23.33 TRINITY_DN400_c0_g1_i2:119-430(+)
MTPKVSLSTSIEESLFSSDDELNPDFQTNNSNNNNVFKLTDSRSITKANKNLSILNQNICNQIEQYFTEINQKILDRKNKLLLDLENIYNSKKEKVPTAWPLV